MTNLYIIGNGFDLDLGLKTSYVDFIGSDEFKELIKPSSDCSFAKYLNEKYRGNYKWMDIENELKIYINNVYDKNGAFFKQEFNLLKKSLREYLNRVTINEKINYNSNAARICNKILTDLKNKVEVRVVNFNYTNTLPYVVKKINSDNGSRWVETEKIIYFNPHGEINNEIVFGIEDGALLDNKKDFLYLTKGADSSHVNSDWHQSYLIANEIIIFGHSLGDSDYDSFDPLFGHLVSSIDSKKTLKLYFLESDADFYNERLDKYTLSGLTKLSINHVILRNPKF
jgi:hypothetical protein